MVALIGSMSIITLALIFPPSQILEVEVEVEVEVEIMGHPYSL